ncbi:MAG: zinc ribbon domain-containing protein [Elusimicrobiota bacterium]
MTSYSDCQSCGMPLKNDPQCGGRNVDGTLSRTYCSCCFTAGRFTQPEMTVDQMKAFCAAKLHRMGIPTLLARLMVKHLHTLERWRPVGATTYGAEPAGPSPSPVPPTKKNRNITRPRKAPLRRSVVLV